MAAEDIIKSYLISLGFEADDEAYRKFNSAISRAASEVSRNTDIMSGSWVKAGAITVGAIGSIITSVSMLLDSISKADLGYQSFAMRMHMAKDAAKEFKIVTDAMGKSQEEISWIKELNVQYKELMRQSASMALPGDYSTQMEFIRGIRFEFTRLKVESVYALEWIGYYLVKDLIDPLNQTKFSFKDFNDYLQNNMSQITRKIADVISTLMKPILSLSEAIKDYSSVFKNLWENMGEEARWIALGAVIGGLFLVSGPIGKAIVGFGILISLIDEFYGALDGKETALPVEAWWAFAAAVDTAVRSIVAFLAIVESGFSLVKAAGLLGIGIGAGGAAIGADIIGLMQGKSGAGADIHKISQNFIGGAYKAGKESISSITGLPEIRTSEKYGLDPFLKGHPNFYLSNEARSKRTDIFGRATKGEAYSISEIPGGIDNLPKNVQNFLLQNSSDTSSTPGMAQYRAMLQDTFGEQAGIMEKIMYAESRGDHRAENLNTKGKYAGSTDYGLLQINDFFWEEKLKKANIIKTMSDLFDPQTNFKAGKFILDNQGLSAWEASKVQAGGGGWGQQGGVVNITYNIHGEESAANVIGKVIDKTHTANKLMYNTGGIR